MLHTFTVPLVSATFSGSRNVIYLSNETVLGNIYK